MILLIVFSFVFSKKVEAVFIRNSTNPILPVVPNTWESALAWNPAVIIDEGVIKVFYAGFNQFGDNNADIQIGLASGNSPTTIVKYQNNPIIKYDFIDPNDNGVHQHFVMKKDNSYRIWLTRNKSQYPYWTFYTAESLDGINWNNPQQLIFSETKNWELDGRFAPNIIYDTNNNIYKMWYTARGSGISGVGYATSINGINWTSYSNNPILTNVGAESLFFENGYYNLIFSANSNLNYAYSVDGINWINGSNNPLLTPDTSDSNAFDYNLVGDADIVKFNSKYYLFYGGRGSSGNWQIGLAVSDDIPGAPPPLSPSATPTPTNSISSTPTPTLTPTPSLSPTPTLSPSPTLTATPTNSPTPTFIPSSPTPTISTNQINPVVFIPGLGSTWNLSAFVSCGLTSIGEWKLNSPAERLYSLLFNNLTQSGLERNKGYYVYEYDWRLSAPAQADELNHYINTTVLNDKPLGTKVKLLGHSLGGIVLRSYLSYYGDSKVEKALTAGSPHKGTVISYPIWEAGEVWKDDLIGQFGMKAVINYCQNAHINLAPYQIIHQVIPSIRDILPVFDYIRNNSLIPFSAMHETNGWIISHPFPQNHFIIPFATLAGTGENTVQELTVTNPTKKEQLIGEWIDGKPTKKDSSKDGDDLILSRSALSEYADQLTFSGDHGDIISEQNSITLILHYLGLITQPLLQSTISAQPIDLISISIDKNIPFVTTDPNLISANSKDGNAVIFNPVKGKYSIELFPTEATKITIMIERMKKEEESKFKTTTITLSKNSPKSISFHYDLSKSTPIEIE